jgi:hypothetical protein
MWIFMCSRERIPCWYYHPRQIEPHPWTGRRAQCADVVAAISNVVHGWRDLPVRGFVLGARDTDGNHHGLCYTIRRENCTFFADTFLIPNSPVIICRTVSLYIRSCSAISLKPNLRSEGTNVRTLSTFASVLCVCGSPVLWSSCNFSRPSSKIVCHSNHSIFS